ncbi:unnamed protein product [Cuscuta epithymum]|uniref:F-box domain-containing protein n=1 Tax=Cuscuta epithymum TaxID=186058 RepID=A0AAV0FNM9_9ASTE|nr:unnamed protein product [Cuscuta epithymum]
MEKRPHKKAKQIESMDEKERDVLLCGLEIEGSSNHKTWIPFDLLFKIFLLLPADTLCRVSFVCKTLFNMITSPNFIEAHLRRSETVLLTLISNYENHNKSLPFAPQPHSQSIVHFFQLWELHSGESSKIPVQNLARIDSVLASCDGLVLAKLKTTRGLVVVNPSSRKHLRFPLGTAGFSPESFGLMRRGHMGEYKVVHLFRDKYLHARCEILSLPTRSWHAVDGPPLTVQQHIILHPPVSATGAMYWLPGRAYCTHIVSLGYDDERFLIIPLPIISTKNDRLVEVGGGLLSFVTHATMHLIQVWILRRRDGGDVEGYWIKRYSINRNYDVTGMVPICTSGREMVFSRQRKNLLHVCDLESDEMKEITLHTEKMNGAADEQDEIADEQDEIADEQDEIDGINPEVDSVSEFTSYIPHVNSLVSLCTRYHHHQ